MLGFFFIFLFITLVILLYRNKIENKKILLRIALWSIPLGYLASQLGWVVAEVGRQPWTIYEILPTIASTSHLSTGIVQTTFFFFLILFTILLITEIRIMLKQIKTGPKENN